MLRIGVEANALTLSGFRTWRRICLQAKLTETSNLVEEERLVKTAAELRVLRKAIAITDRIYEQVSGILKPGLTEQALAGKIDEWMRKEGAEPGFKTIVASGSAAASPHHITSAKKLRNGELVMMDFGARFGGYHSDLTRTVFLGTINKKFSQNYELVKKAQAAAIKRIKPGVTAKSIDAAARQVIAQAGAGRFFTHTTGHGVGLEVHEGPRLSTQETKKLAAGMVVTVEPGVYIPGWGGIRIEDVVLVTENGCQVLSRSKK